MSFHNLLVSGKTGEVALPSPLSWGLLGSHFYFMQRVFPQSLPRIGFPLGRRAQVFFVTGAVRLSVVSQVPLPCLGPRLGLENRENRGEQKLSWGLMCLYLSFPKWWPQLGSVLDVSVKGV